MRNKLAKQMRKHVKETMAESAVWELYDIKNITKQILDHLGNTHVITVPVKSLVKGCGKQRYKAIKQLYRKVV